MFSEIESSRMQTRFYLIKYELIYIQDRNLKIKTQVAYYNHHDSAVHEISMQGNFDSHM